MKHKKVPQIIEVSEFEKKTQACHSKQNCV